VILWTSNLTCFSHPTHNFSRPATPCVCCSSPTSITLLRLLMKRYGSDEPISTRWSFLHRYHQFVRKHSLKRPFSQLSVRRVLFHLTLLLS
jgi:hypothetical protein